MGDKSDVSAASRGESHEGAVSQAAVRASHGFVEEACVGEAVLRDGIAALRLVVHRPTRRFTDKYGL